MSEKSHLSFKSFFGKRTHLSYICFAVLLVTSFISYFAVEIYNERKTARLADERRPKVDLQLWQKDIQAHHDKTGRYPKNLRELENVVWKNGVKSADSKLLNGDNIYSLNNYLIMYAGSDQVASLWAIPTGAARDEGNTYFLLIAPKQVQTWKGAALGSADIERIPRTVVPTDRQMAALGMSIQNADKSGQEEKKQTFFSPFGRKN